MGIFEIPRTLMHRFLRRPPILEPDLTLDTWIREALLDDVTAQPSPDAWERLCRAISDRRLKSYGMWVLDEPWRDPPESLPTALNGRQFQRARRLLDHDNRTVPIWQIAYASWGSVYQRFLP
jgi:hypothetical protein